ncbi:hypothetical protein ACFXDK_26265 [Actinacidiphila glaucinigra]|uniref:hypothetical protein n=1 Tax=Actinacidiphila glaucinigra TaxID=235986 RepID=UPI00366CAF4F
MDLDGGLVIAHSDKQDATPTWKKAFGHHPLMDGLRRPRTGRIRRARRWSAATGNAAGSNTAADHITDARFALAQLPKRFRRGRQSLIEVSSTFNQIGLGLARLEVVRASRPRPQFSGR